MSINIAIAGMPRSGTSLLSNILTHMGVSFTGGNKGVDEWYPSFLNPSGYFQRQDVHFLCYNLGLRETFYPDLDAVTVYNTVQKILDNTHFVENSLYRGIKEPYMLPLLNELSDRNQNMITILVFRNPEETVASGNNFVLKCNETRKISYKNWTDYYLAFLTKCKPKNVIFFNYNEFLSNPVLIYTKLFDKLVSYLPKLKKLTDMELTHLIKPRDHVSNSLLSCSSQSKFIYKILENEILSVDYTMFNLISKMKANDKCFCGSGKKYKKCCR